jgi:hypothetical protein
MLLRRMVLDAVDSPHTRRNDGKALGDLFAFFACEPLSGALLPEWRLSMESLSLSIIRWWRGQRAGMIGQEEAASLTDVPSIRQKGTGWRTG